jgi:hypothetical protein
MIENLKDLDKDFKSIKKDMENPNLEGYLFISTIEKDTKVLGEIPRISLAEAIANILIKQEDVVLIVSDILLSNESKMINKEK